MNLNQEFNLITCSHWLKVQKISKVGMTFKGLHVAHQHIVKSENETDGEDEGSNYGDGEDKGL